MQGLEPAWRQWIADQVRNDVVRVQRKTIRHRHPGLDPGFMLQIHPTPCLIKFMQLEYFNFRRSKAR